LTDILLEEIADIRSIMRGVAEKASQVAQLFGELAAVVKRATEDGLNELKHIEQRGVAALRTIPYGDPLHRKLYTQIVRSISSIRSRAVVLNRLADSMTLSASLASQNSAIATALRALRAFVDDVASVLKDLSGISVHVLVEYAYISLSILMSGYGAYVVCAPSYDLFKPWKWVLLLHELGHAVFELRRGEYIKLFRSRISPLLRELAPRGIEAEHGYEKLFEENWLKEFVADLYGVHVGGSSFTSAFMVEVFYGDPSMYRETHPSLDSRMNVQLKYLKEILKTDTHTGSIEEKWLRHRRSIDIEEPRYPFSKEILGEVVEVFREVAGPPPFLNYADEMLRAVEALNSGRIPEGRPLVLVIASALSDKGREEASQRSIIEVLSKL